MKRIKYSAVVLAALTCCGALWASVAALNNGKKVDNGEKVRPSENFLAQAKKAPVVRYAKMNVDGNADGVPYGLSLMSVTDRTVKLSWISPEKTDGYFDDFENHQDFAVNSAGNIGWSYIDGDNTNTYTWQACKFPTQGDKMAFVVMNPWMTTPAVNENPNYQPYSGHKMLVDFSSIDDKNNDYIISPELNFDQDFQVSFMARSYKVADGYAAERIRVGYSTTGKRPSDFTYVNDGPYVELPAAWTLVKYNIPKEAKYVTINCISENGFMLLMDDLFIGTNKVRPGSTASAKQLAAANPVVGFNVYRNGEKITEAPGDSVRFTDQVPDYGDYTYTVTAVYQNGQESAQSEPLQVNVPDIRTLPFEDSFDDWTLGADKWSTQIFGKEEESHWSIDYYEYGLVNPCATYKWSASTNYDEALMTRELHTLDRANTALRFKLKLRNSQQTNVDYLEVEVSSDGGKTWDAFDSFDNYSGAFDWKVCQYYDLGEVLNSDLFRVRFRAHGKDAKWINYWYVDDVKIWNPVWAKGSLSVTTPDGVASRCPVTLTGDNGTVIEETTDSKGNISFDQIEEGTYTVSIKLDGYSEYTGTWTVKKDENNQFKAELTKPKAEFSTNEVSAGIEAESSITKNFKLSNPGTGLLTWYLRENVTPGSGSDANRWKTMPSFKTSGDLQQSVAFDGQYYYTTSSIELGKFWKYDKNFNLIEQFSIPEMYYKLYDITYDGRYFYGSDWANRLFVLDFDHRKIVKIINISSESDLKITHCSYDPVNDGFWIGSFTTIGLIDRNGRFIRKLANITSNNSASIYGSAYDGVSPGGPYLWLSDMTTESDDKLDKIQIQQYDITKGVLTGVKHVLTDAPGYVLGNSSSGANYVCGLFSSMDIVPGQLTLIGSLMQSPNLIFRYTLAEANQWLNITPKHGTLNGGEEQEFNVVFDALQAQKGDSYETTATLFTNPETEPQEISFKLNATAESSTPRPQSVKATPGSACVNLTWDKGNGSATATSYNVYRNGVKVNAEPIKEMQYTDNKLIYGSYSYQVTALYGDKESAKSDSVVTFVKDGAQYYAPINVTSNIIGNKDVHLTWDSPLANAEKNSTMTWGNGTHADELGLSAGGYYFVGSKWEAADYAANRNKKVTSMSIQLVNTVTYMAARIYKDGEIIYSRRYRGDIKYDGSLTEVPISSDITLEPGHEYIFAFQLMNDADVNPVAMDNGKPVNGKGNLLSLDGKSWFTAAESAIDGNFNININLEPKAGSAEEAPVGYNIYRNGVKVNSSVIKAQNFDEELTEQGVYNYTVTSVYADGGESGQSAITNVEIYDNSKKNTPHHLNATVERNRNVSIRWDNPTLHEQTIPADLAVRPVTTDANCPEYINSFEGAKSSMAIATDGKYIYTSIYADNGAIEKYTLDGQKVQGYVVDGIDGIRNLAYDGEYLYAGDYSNNIYKINPETMKLVETIAISEYSRHLAYIPTLNNGKGGFETGDWTTSIYIGKDGSKLGEGPTYAGAAGTAYYDGKIYAFEQGNNENAYTIGIYDMSTGNKVGKLDMGKYLELKDIESYRAGGMSSFTAPDGVTYMLLALQRQDYPTKFVILDMGGLKTVAGYNIYSYGEKLNKEPLTRRYFEESLTNAGTYFYSVKTVYIDGTESEMSDVTDVTILQAGTAKVPESVKATQASYGYNAIISFKDPYMYQNAAEVNSFETEADGTEVKNEEGESTNWTVSTDAAYDGSKAITAAEKKEAFGIFKAEGMKYIRMAVKNADDHKGNGTIGISYSTGGDHRDNFIRLNTYTTNEAWQDVLCELPEGTEYVAITKAEGNPAQYVDNIAFYKEAPTTDCYGFYIYRNGEKLNEEPVQGISYVDHNLLQGDYTYQVGLITNLSAESEPSAAVALSVYYDNGSLAPTNLRVEETTEGRNLTWQAPALGEPIYLRWHDGSCYDAGGQQNGGAFFAGANWFAEDLKDYSNLQLSDVEVYINQVPDALYLLVYQNNTLVRQQFVPTLKQYSFNTIHLEEPLQIDPSKSMRVAVYVEHNEITVPLGYDRGPARSGRGDLYSSDGITWSTMSDSGSDIDANWNISIGLSPYSADGTLKAKKQGETAAQKLMFAPKAVASNAASMKVAKVLKQESSEKNAFLGYNVYMNGDKLNESMIQGNAYTDNSNVKANYLEYQVAAVYSKTGEKFSNKVTLMTTGINGVESQQLKVEVAGNTLRIIGAHTGDKIAVYALDGKTILEDKVGDTYIQNVSLSALNTGTYIVKVGKSNFKVRVSNN